MRSRAFWADKNQSILNNISDFAGENELMNKEKAAVWAKFAYTAADGKFYDVDYYNLDVIISLGYRVKSKRGTQLGFGQ